VGMLERLDDEVKLIEMLVKTENSRKKIYIYIDSCQFKPTLINPNENKRTELKLYQN